jgi:hypothetical protein
LAGVLVIHKYLFSIENKEWSFYSLISSIIFYEN